MAGSTRRALMTGLVGAGIAGGFVWRGALLASETGLALPDGAMRLTRELVRELGGGAAITVRRAWAVGFVRQGRGIAISGRQISASVDAPPNLAGLARIEEQRDTAGMFPIILSATGRIVAAGNESEATDDIAPALRAAEQIIASRPQSEDRRESLRRYLAEIHRAGSGQFDTLPADLFYPLGTPLRQAETVTLPDGLTGEFSLVWNARAVPGSGWLDEGVREIVTRIEGLERRSRETWTMTPA